MIFVYMLNNQTDKAYFWRGGFAFSLSSCWADLPDKTNDNIW